VRIGPYATRQEAEAAAARVKATGLQAAVLTL
jgi:cell division protein FtsN